jgi:8-oxo-dGTP diphosphatase
MPEKQKSSANVGVSVMVRSGKSLLLEKRAHVHGAGTWGPPSGHINFGETPEATAQRETSEETGVEITDLKFLGVTNDVFEAEQRHYITLWFEATYMAGEAQVRAPEEISEVGWFPQDALPQPLFLPLQHFVEENIYVSHTSETEPIIYLQGGR